VSGFKPSGNSLLTCDASSSQLHLRTISTNQAHPLATHPIIRFPKEVNQAWKIKIFEDRIVLWFRDETRTQGRLWFCNWRTGEIIEVGSSISGFQFLNHRSAQDIVAWIVLPSFPNHL
jgi:hypothetical protein